MPYSSCSICQYGEAICDPMISGMFFPSIIERPFITMVSIFS